MRIVNQLSCQRVYTSVSYRFTFSHYASKNTRILFPICLCIFQIRELTKERPLSWSEWLQIT